MLCENIINFMLFGKIFGPKNLAMFYGKNWARVHLPLTLPVFGTVSHKEELLNIRDNILQGSIRDRNIEKQIRSAKRPVIVDCGINVGITVRWWFYLNPQAAVYGIDMMQEAKKFTMDALSDRFKAQYMPITAVLVSETGRPLEIRYDDPLFGGNSIDGGGQYEKKRHVPAMTLDDCLSEYTIDAIDLLKVDIENSAAPMFQGAVKTLKKVRNILLEIHSEEECRDSIRLLSENGFHVSRSYKRHIWLKKIDARV